MSEMHPLALYVPLAPLAGAVITVEIDGHLFELASEQLIDLPNVTMLHLDALKNKNHFNPLVLEAIGEQLAAAPDAEFGQHQRDAQHQGQADVHHHEGGPAAFRRLVRKAPHVAEADGAAGCCEDEPRPARKRFTRG